MKAALTFLSFVVLVAACSDSSFPTRPGPLASSTADAGDASTNEPPRDAGDCGVCAPGLVCDTDTAACVECFKDEQCLSGSCTNAKTCAPCAEDKDCGGGYCVGLRCVACTTDAHCPSGACFSGVCVECTALKTDQCVAPRPLCDDKLKTCVQCLESPDCPPNAPVCTAGVCGECENPDGCSGRPTEPACVDGRCAECGNGNLAACDPEQKFCSAENRCALCLVDDHCPASSPQCGEDGCGRCTSAQACVNRADTLACDPSTGQCVPCTSDDPGSCTVNGQVCLDGGTVCVDCNEDKDCSSRTDTPVCDDNKCRKCEQDSECQGDGKVCREETGECVACEANKDNPEAENCANGNACDPKLFTCTGQPRRTLATCGASTVQEVGVVPCVSDNECIANHRCVPTNFPKDVFHGNYCLRQIGVGACPNQTAARRMATSTLGVADFYCFPDDGFTTCEGLLDQELCPGGDDDCGADGLNDGLCKTGRCTYGCDGNADCSGTNGCTGPIGEKYCNPN